MKLLVREKFPEQGKFIQIEDIFNIVIKKDCTIITTSFLHDILSFLHVPATQEKRQKHGQSTKHGEH